MQLLCKRALLTGWTPPHPLIVLGSSRWRSLFGWRRLLNVFVMDGCCLYIGSQTDLIISRRLLYWGRISRVPGLLLLFLLHSLCNLFLLLRSQLLNFKFIRGLFLFYCLSLFIFKEPSWGRTNGLGCLGSHLLGWTPPKLNIIRRCDDDFLACCHESITFLLLCLPHLHVKSVNHFVSEGVVRPWIFFSKVTVLLVFSQCVIYSGYEHLVVCNHVCYVSQFKLMSVS